MRNLQIKTILPQTMSDVEFDGDFNEINEHIEIVMTIPLRENLSWNARKHRIFRIDRYACNQGQ